MPWELRDKEFESVMKLDAPKRYEYAIKRIADREELWGLWKGGWAFLGADNGREAVAVFPTRTSGESRGVVVEPSQMLADLRRELDLIE